MKTTMRWVTGLMLSAFAGALLAAPASADSVRTLIELTRTREMLDDMMKNVEGTIRQGAMAAIARRSGGQLPTATQQATIDRVVARAAELFRSDLRWENVEPDYVRIYTDTFDQDEVDGMIAFYRTPIGQTLIAKMPSVLHQAMALSQARLRVLMPQIMAVTAEEVKSAP